MTQLNEFEIPEDPDKQNELFVRIFNSGDGALYDSMYTADAISNISGAPLTGQERTAFFKEFLASGPTIDSRVLQAYTSGDTSLLIVDYSLDVPGPDGQTMHMHGTCTDVLIRDENGDWRLAIDRPVPDQEHAA
ncbi:YybH family protein [Streptomyces sp. NPDC003753]|uniref:YybH family protein n=1 Tax=unclassified Streptomyces TaxID=2593676 RepID=UPI0019078C08|nr:nuclear transport factor 2 family protein [Streptomyces sp. Y2F8-2]